MFLRLLLLFTLVPLAELYLLVVLGREFGVLSTFLLVIVTGALGAYLAREQGLRTWRRFQEEVGRGGLPAGTLVDGLLLLVAGAVLLTPGLLTDVFGFVLLIPAGRRRIAAFVRRALERRISSANAAGRVIVVDSRPIDPEVRPTDHRLPPG